MPRLFDILQVSNLRHGLRASLGCAASLALCSLLGSYWLDNLSLLHLLGPLAASALLLFAVPSGALAQPWALLGSYLCSAPLALLLNSLQLPSLWLAGLALGMSLLLMSLLRCVHPPAGALAVVLALAEPPMADQGPGVLLALLVMLTCLLGCALCYLNLSGSPYPLRRTNEPRHATQDPPPQGRAGISSDDLEQVLAEFDAFVDITPEELARLLQAGEQLALRRRVGDLQARHIMSRDLRWISPQASRTQAMAMLRRHRIRSLPVLDEQARLVGVVSLVDLLSRPRGVRRQLAWGLRQPLRVAELMSTPVRSVQETQSVSAMIGLLSSQGLHSLPVLDDQQRLVGIVSQSDLIGALQEQLLR